MSFGFYAGLWIIWTVIVAFLAHKYGQRGLDELRDEKDALVAKLRSKL